MERFAERLRSARQAMGLTQEQLGFALGVTKSSVSAWETGRETPSFTLLPGLRKTLQRSLDELICGPGRSTAASLREEAADYRLETISARDPREQALLLRFRSLPPRRRAALLELIAAEPAPK